MAWEDSTTLLQVVVVTTVGCQYCKRAKDTLRVEKVEYNEIEASNQLELLKKIRASTGKRTVPQVGLTAHTAATSQPARIH